MPRVNLLEHDGLRIKIANRSNLVWERDIWAVGAGQSDQFDWTSELTHIPSDKLEPGGFTAAGAHQAWFKGLARTTLYIRLGYSSPFGSTDGSFAVLVRHRFQLIYIGGGCQWQVWDKEWKNLGDNTSEYTWTFATNSPSK
jgi:hypothetical protein